MKKNQKTNHQKHSNQNIFHRTIIIYINKYNITVVKIMKNHLIGMTSITYAVKAQKLLISKGYRCQVVSTPPNVGSGCGYSLSVSDDPQIITDILSRAGIKYKEIY